MRALRQNNQNVGGGYVIRSGEASLVQGIARTTSVEQIADIMIASHDGVPIRIRDVADVAIGNAIRRGGVTAEGKGEAVLGLAFMRMGENSRDVTTCPGPGHGRREEIAPARRHDPRGLQTDRPR